MELGVRIQDIVLGVMAGGIRGQALDPYGLPVKNAIVYAGPWGGTVAEDELGQYCELAGPAPTRTNQLGEFVLPGGYASPSELHAMAAGFPAWSGSADIPIEGQANVQIKLQEQALVEGLVTDAEGRPVAGARVICALDQNGGVARGPFPYPRTDCDELGRYRLELIPAGKQSFSAMDRGGAHGRQVLQAECTAGITQIINIELDPNPVLLGRLTDPDGNPLVGWSIEVCGTRSMRVHWASRTTQTNSSGEFQLSNVSPADLKLSVMEPGGWEPRLIKLLKRGTHEVELTVSDETRGHGFFSGTLALQDGGRLEGLDLILWNSEGPQSGEFVDYDPSSGFFRHKGPSAGRYTLVARGPEGRGGRSQPFELPGGVETDLGQILIQAPGRVEVQIPGLSTAALSQLPLRLTRAHCATESLRLKGGKLVSNELAAGTWTLTCSKGEIYVAESVVVQGGRTTQINASFQRTYALDARLEFEGETLDRLNISITNAEGITFRKGGWLYVWWHSFQFNLPPGRFKIELESDTNLRATREFLFVPGETQELVLRLE